MSAGSIVMMCLGLAVTWGGAFACIVKAIKKRDV